MCLLFSCVIAGMCVPRGEFQRVNPTTQVALFTICIGNCSNIQTIEWNIYQGQRNSSTNMTQWTPFASIAIYDNIWFFGRQTSNFTASNQLFVQHPQITYWRFEVIYTFANATSQSALDFIINQPPSNGSCSIHPSNGTTTTLFTISCSNWFDDDQIKDYSLYGIWFKNTSDQTIIAFSMESTFTVRLPAGENEDSRVHLFIHIRDGNDCIRKVNLSSVTVSVERGEINSFINNFDLSSNVMNRNPLVRLLSSGNQNIIGQILISISQQFNWINDENINRAISSK
jgi:REJ domain